ncbi:short-chain dehydrogenase reductase SDR [Secundilactobacillus odoratitofui DSM 19909 = JCM 15043]|uniref:Short-chain dehydrogenase reductase SDR n=1 Tax=Secundilactobacillus odoratitofui DSM 19909 = JCM 15043 TaxID=1423776 RepID=A0A0R1LNP7_9LACO|nr:SDR family NAD(P)-dependent oxidoreductase [Secundilactobacillus odoratitofui]KRK97494.1 short-chain dehydrogenase reductase SDR [Secundilactobacillus odoratitofui DSM 19909 = JCM 15043]
MKYDYQDKTVIVTGGAKGIGKEVTKGIIAGGGSVALLDIDDEAAAATAKELGGNVKTYHVDQANREQVNETFQQIIQDFTKVDALINVAGVISAKPFDELPPEEWDRTIKINLTGPYNTVHAIWEHFKANGGGRIVNVSSVAGKIGGGLLGTVAYASSKAGVNGFTKAIAKEGGKYGIYANAVAPSFTHTSMTTSLSEDPVKNQKVISIIPLGRPAEPVEIAQMILFFGCDAASFITGEIGDADGGVVMDG